MRSVLKAKWGDDDVEIRIVDKGSEYKECYGLVVLKNGSFFTSSVYPCVTSSNDIDSLKDFLETLKDELISFYLEGHRIDFGSYIYGSNGDAKLRFRDDWHKKGVLIY